MSLTLGGQLNNVSATKNTFDCPRLIFSRSTVMKLLVPFFVWVDDLDGVDIGWKRGVSPSAIGELFLLGAL